MGDAMNVSKRLVAAAVLTPVILAPAIWYLVAEDPAEAVVVAKVDRGDIEQTVVATGKLEPEQLVGVGAQVSGQVKQLNVALGQMVRKGTLIARIDAQPQENALRTAEAELANVGAQRAAQLALLRRAELALRRQQAMGPGEATSRADFEAATAELRSAQANVAALDAQIRQAKVNVASARVNLGYTSIVAPIDGVVVAVVTKQGQTVNSALSTPTIVVLARLDRMRIKAEISEADVIRVRPGLPVHFTILGDPEHRYHARLRQVQPAPESIVNDLNAAGSSTTTGASGSGTGSSGAVYYNALFEVPNHDGRLRAMMTAQVSVVLDRRSNVLRMPATALGARTADGRYSVRIRDNTNRIITRQVRIGLNNKVMVEVLDGLRAGDAVVVGESDPADRAASAAALTDMPL